MVRPGIPASWMPPLVGAVIWGFAHLLLESRCSWWAFFQLAGSLLEDSRMKRTLHFASLMDRQPACQSVRLVSLTCCHTFGFVRPCAAVQPARFSLHFQSRHISLFKRNHFPRRASGLRAAEGEGLSPGLSLIRFLVSFSPDVSMSASSFMSVRFATLAADFF